MIKDYSNGKLVQVCSACGQENIVNAPTEPPTPVPELGGAIPAVKLPPCPACGAVEFLNPNIPTASEDMLVADSIPESEWRQRTIVRALMSALKLRRPTPISVPEIPKEMLRIYRQREEAK